MEKSHAVFSYSKPFSKIFLNATKWKKTNALTSGK